MHKAVHLGPVLSVTEPPRSFCAWSVNRPICQAERSYCIDNWTMHEGAWQARSKKLRCWSGLLREPANQYQKDRGFCLLCQKLERREMSDEAAWKNARTAESVEPNKCAFICCCSWLSGSACVCVQFFACVCFAFCLVFFSWFTVLCCRQNFTRLAWVSLLRGNMLVYLSALEYEQTKLLAEVLV